MKIKNFAIMNDNEELKMVKDDFRDVASAREYMRRNHLSSEGYFVAELEDIETTDYKDECIEYYKSKLMEGQNFYLILSALISEADRMKTRKSRLRKLHELNPRMVDGYLLVNYGKVTEEIIYSDNE